MLAVGLLLGFVGGTAATIACLFVADHLRHRNLTDRLADEARQHWLETANWDNTADYPAM